jgi:hypothetical protein
MYGNVSMKLFVKIMYYNKDGKNEVKKDQRKL